MSTIYEPLNQYYVVLALAPEYTRRARTRSENVHLYLEPRAAHPCRSRLSHAGRPSNAPLSVNHQGQFAAATFSFNLAPGVPLEQAAAAIEAASASANPDGSVRGSFAGTMQAFLASLASQPWLILSALLMVYLVLGVLYESLLHPLTILSTLPSAGVGALLALLRDQERASRSSR